MTPEGTPRQEILHDALKAVPESALASLPAREQAWEMARYRAYQACLVGHTTGETFGRAVTFLTRTGANAASSTVTSGDTRR